MPTYVYECPECKTQVELVQKISEREAPTCENPECPSPGKMNSVITGGSFVLKGTGWARDGYSNVTVTGFHHKLKK